MIRLRLLLLLTSICFALFSKAQLSKDIFPLNREFKNGSFYVSPQLTYSVGIEKKEEINIDNTTYNYKISGMGKLGYGLEVGWFQSFENPRLVHYVEAGIAYRKFSGDATHSGTQLFPDFSQIEYKSQNTFDIQTAVASLRAVNVKQLGKFTFLNSAIGANVNYLFSENYNRPSIYPNTVIGSEKFPDQLHAQLHFQIGIGLRLSRQWLLVPNIETPILTAYPLDDPLPPFKFFDAYYQPIILSFKIMYLREDPENCNAPIYRGPAHQ